MRDREIAVWDARALSSPLTRESVATAPGVLLPLYDEDSNMLFLVGKVGPMARARNHTIHNR